MVKTAEVSTYKLVKGLQLDASDTNFENFQKFVNDQCFLVLDSMYGEFASFTGPILTQSTLSEIAGRFKTTLPKHYHSISALLNRSKNYNLVRFHHLRGQWDCKILYMFLAISQKRNPKFFTSWALINTASSYGGKNVDIQVFFGLAIIVGYKYLHLTRINHTTPLYSGLSKQGEPMANWALDGLIEMVQKYYHKMNFHTGKGNGWLTHLPHVMIMSKASRIVVEEYSCLNSIEDKDSKFVDHQDNNIKTSKGYKNTKASSAPKK